MIPLRDSLPTRRRPVLTWALLVANVAAFLHERAAIASGYVEFVADWGFVPARFVADPMGEAVTIVTSMFLHGGIAHLAFNMLFLWIFGDNVEDRLGRSRFLTFYFGSGLFAALAQMAIDPSSQVPMVGASGAIAGVLGGYAVLYPGSPVKVFLPPIFFFELPAWVVIGEWFLVQLSQGFSSLVAADGGGGVAFFAHIGGFVAGLVLVRRMTTARGPYDDDDGWRPPVMPPPPPHLPHSTHASHGHPVDPWRAHAGRPRGW